MKNIFFHKLLLFVMLTTSSYSIIWSTSYFTVISSAVNADINTHMSAEIKSVNKLTKLYKFAIKSKYEEMKIKEKEIVKLQKSIVLIQKSIEQKEEVLRKLKK